MSISFGFFNNELPTLSRDHKGRSLLDLPCDYTLLDIETTGLDPRWDSIIEVCAIRVRNFVPVSTFTTLVYPGFEIDSFISELTGITNELLSKAPRIESIIDDFYYFISNDILISFLAIMIIMRQLRMGKAASIRKRNL